MHLYVNHFNTEVVKVELTLTTLSFGWVDNLFQGSTEFNFYLKHCVTIYLIIIFFIIINLCFQSNQSANKCSAVKSTICSCHMYTIIRPWGHFILFHLFLKQHIFYTYTYSEPIRVVGGYSELWNQQRNVFHAEDILVKYEGGRYLYNLSGLEFWLDFIAAETV